MAFPYVLTLHQSPTDGGTIVAFTSILRFTHLYDDRTC